MKIDEEKERTRVLGKLNLKPFAEAFGEIQTDEIIITNERIEHIFERHQGDYELFLKYAETTVTHPDIIRVFKVNEGLPNFLRVYREGVLGF